MSDKDTDQQHIQGIRAAMRDEAALLTELALRSKGHWGYDAAFLDACCDDLTITPEYITTHPAFVLEENNRVVGFYGLRPLDDEVELAYLFVEPDAIGGGYGKRLFQHAVTTATELGFHCVVIESEPFAEAFYKAMGARRIGEVASPVQQDRLLPLLHLPLTKVLP